MIDSILKTAIEWRQNQKLLDSTEALRLFYGPGESNHPELKSLAIDLFGKNLWITQWTNVSDATVKTVCETMSTLSFAGFPKIESIVLMDRSQVSDKMESAQEVKTIWGKAPDARFSVSEFSVPYLIQFHATKHPGLFLDHAPLRQWLLHTQKDKTVLNLFSYTGALSVAAAKGGASHVTTLDLSKATIEWAQENWKHAGLDEAAGNFIYGDAFEWLPRLAKKGLSFDTILCDPPSFSRSKNGTFSTQKDSARLHELIFPLLKKGGVLVTSINSENFSERDFLKELHLASQKTNSTVRILRRVDLPESFPTSSAQIAERYLKGFYLLKE